MNDIIGLIGYMGLTGAFLMCLIIIILSTMTHFKRFTGMFKLTAILMHLQTILLAISVLTLAILLQKGAYQYEQVFNAVETLMKPGERIGGLWSGQAASLLFWSFIMSSAASFAVLIGKRMGDQKKVITAVLILEFSLIFFIAPDIFVSNPFAKIFQLPGGEITAAFFAPPGADLLVPVDGQGMNPSLRHIAMLLHPPTLYVGLIGLFVPYAFALSALFHQDKSHAWIKILFPVTLVSYIFLTVGMLLGSWWAYTILGWGGYWGWDAVEISGLLPWLLSFGLLHAMRLTMRKKAVTRWVYGFSFAIVILTLSGILITRSGILESVHTYSSGPMGPILTALILIHITAVVLAYFRNRGAAFTSQREKKIPLALRINTWFFWCIIGLVVIYLFGQTLPLTSQIVLAEKISFTPADYEQYSAPLLFLLLILTAACPLVNQYEQNPRNFWRPVMVISILAIAFPITALFFAPFSIAITVGFWASGFLLLSWVYTGARDIDLPILQGKPARSWTRYLGMVTIHLGLAIMAVGIVGVEMMSDDYSLTLSPDTPIAFDAYTITYQPDTSVFEEQGNPSYTADIIINTPNGSDKHTSPAIIHYFKTGAFHVVPAIEAGFFRDMQVVLENFPASSTSDVDVHIAFFPLMSWIWTGGALMAAGGLLPLFFRKHGKS